MRRYTPLRMMILTLSANLPTFGVGGSFTLHAMAMSGCAPSLSQAYFGRPTAMSSFNRLGVSEKPKERSVESNLPGPKRNRPVMDCVLVAFFCSDSSKDFVPLRSPARAADGRMVNVRFVRDAPRNGLVASNLMLVYLNSNAPRVLC